MTPDEKLANLAQAAVWSAAMARQAGFTTDQIRWLRGREWQVLRQGIYSFAGVEPSALMRAAAAVLAAGGRLEPRAAPPITCSRPIAPPAVAAGRTAARVWEIPLVDDEDPATQRFEAEHDDVMRRRGSSTVSTLHVREVAPPPEDVVHVHGVPVLSPLRTLLDLPLALRPDALVAALDSALHNGLIDERVLRAAAGASRRGCVALRSALALTDHRAESPHESLTRLVLKPALPGLEPQVAVFGAGGRLVARLDLGDRTLKLGVESDGAAFHAGRAAADRRRDFRTGWTIERVSWFETRCEQGQLLRRVLATADRLRQGAA